MPICRSFTISPAEYACHILQQLNETSDEYKAIVWALTHELEEGVRNTILLALTDRVTK